MPASYMSLFPLLLNELELMKLPIQTSITLAELASRSIAFGLEMTESTHDLGLRFAGRFLPLVFPTNQDRCEKTLGIYQEMTKPLFSLAERQIVEHLDSLRRKRLGELKFLELFTQPPSPQDWSSEYDATDILLDLPSFRLIDISAHATHRIHNYGVVFAPRAGHHSNIAERVALFMRDQGLSRMAIVEQKCAEDIPLTINGKRHYEDFDSQVQQYVEILKHLKELTGFPPHLIAVCQPGPLLMSSLILHPDLGRTFGSAGAPMHTDGERGYLTDFARLVGGDYIDVLTQLLGRTIPAGHVGEGRQYYDGRFQVFGFYFLGIDQHLRNFRRLLSDLKYGDKEDAERQLAFYQWYNHVQHSPLGFIRDTYKKIFVNNELVRGILTIAGRKIGIKDYPPSIPIWALGGTRDDITPPLQATGHMDLIDSVPGENKMTLLCEAGHMGLFRSAKVLEEYYTRIVEFILKHSDRV